MNQEIVNQKPEVMAPVGSYESLQAALNAGCNSIYFGISQLNMRSRAANNFGFEDLVKIVSACKEKNVKTYLTVNTIMYDHDISLMKKIVDAAKEHGITAIIASDVAVMQYCNEVGVSVHISTQANVSNIESLKFYAHFANVVVLARELTIQQIKSIYEEIQKQDIRGPNGDLVRIEAFVHGALCVAISGKCYMSLATENASANRGACVQNCRREYTVTDDAGNQLKIDNEYIMSPKDLCTIGFLDKLIDAGIRVLKIEGRGRAPDYVYETVSCYREALDALEAGEYTKEKIDSWMKRLESVYNRGFWQGGYYMGKTLGEWSGDYGSKATTKKIYLGRARNYYSTPQVGEFHLETGELNIGDEILVTGPTTGIVKTKVSKIISDEGEIKTAKKGDIITVKIDKVRDNDKLYKLESTESSSGEDK